MKTLILGMGNTILNDDAIGIIVSRYFKKYLNDSDNIIIKETSWGGFRIIDLLRGFDYVIIIDSIKTEKVPPGHIHKLKISDLLPTLRLNSYHDINFITALKLAESLNEKMPTEIDILAIEIKNNFTIVEELSEEIKNSIYNCTIEILNLLKKNNIPINNLKIEESISVEDIQKLYCEEEII